MGITISVDQDEADGGGWTFTATFRETADDGTVISEASAQASIGSTVGQDSTDVFCNGARLALVQLEAETS